MAEILMHSNPSLGAHRVAKQMSLHGAEGGSENRV